MRALLLHLGAVAPAHEPAPDVCFKCFILVMLPHGSCSCVPGLMAVAPFHELSVTSLAISSLPVLSTRLQRPHLLLPLLPWPGTLPMPSVQTALPHGRWRLPSLQGPSLRVRAGPLVCCSHTCTWSFLLGWGVGGGQGRARRMMWSHCQGGPGSRLAGMRMHYSCDGGEPSSRSSTTSQLLLSCTSRA